MKKNMVFVFAAFLLLSFFYPAAAQDWNDFNDFEQVFEEPLPPEESAPPARPAIQRMPPAPARAGLSTISAPTKDNKISLDIKGMDIVDVLKMLAARSGLNIVVGRNVTGRVTLFIKDVDVWDAFELILLANDLAYEEKGGIINVMSQRDYQLIYGERYKDKKKAKIIQLKYARAQDLSAALNQMKTSVGKIVVDVASNTLALIDMPEKIREMEEFIENVDSPLETKVFSLDYAQAQKINDKVKEVISKNVGSIRIDERTNKIIVTDYPNKIRELEKIVAAFDEKTPQVLIDAQIIEVSPIKDDFSFGVNWDWWVKNNVRVVSTLAAPAVTGIGILPDIAYGMAAKNGKAATVDGPGKYKSIIEALRVVGETKILSSPRIMVLNNQEAKILVGKKDAYITSTTSQGSSGQTVTSQSVNFVDTGIKLFVTPTANRDGFITMKIRPEVSSAESQDITSEDKKTQIPIVTTSETETTVMIKDGTTIVIAGLKKDNVQEEVQKIPLLGDIPMFKYIFSNVKKKTTKTELVIFITPTIVTGEEPLEYVSSSSDKDVARIQTIAKAEYSENRLQEFYTVQYYRESVFDKIKSASNLLKKQIPVSNGEVEVIFKLNALGQLEDEPVIASSTNKNLNAAALKCVKNSAPFAPFPDSLKKKSEVFKISLAYK